MDALKVNLVLKLILVLVNNINCSEFSYQLSGKMMSSLADPNFYDEDPFIKLEGGESPVLSEYLSNYKNSTGTKGDPKLVQNLDKLIDHFGNEKCLIVINNLIETDLRTSNSVPVLLRQFELAVLHKFAKLELNTELRTDILWTRKEYLPYLNGNFTGEDVDTHIHPCHISKYFTPLTIQDNGGYCIGLDPNTFSSSSKPWLCEVQIDFFMPKHLLDFGKHTQIFRSLKGYGSLEITSSMPKINILLQTQQVLEEFEGLSVLNWLSRKNSDFSGDMSDFEIVADFMLYGYISCHNNSKDMFIIEVCQITNFRILFPCTECQKMYLEIELNLNSLKISHITNLDKIQSKFGFTGWLEANSQKRFDLEEQIKYFILTEPNTIKSPIKHYKWIQTRYQDKIQLLAYAYASIFKDIVGNVTWRESIYFKDTKIYYFTRVANLKLVDEPRSDDLIKIKLKFGQLHFVSCGSRGIEPISFLHIVTVFEMMVWIWLLVIIALVAICCKTLTGREYLKTFGGIIRVLLEQGDSFPETPNFKRKFGFPLCGIFLTGLILSNAFKSENVYKIVTPRQLISYHSIQELVADGYKIYSRITRFSYQVYRDMSKKYLKLDQHSVFLVYKKWSVFANSEFSDYFEYSDDPVKENLLENSQIHPNSGKIFKEPVDLLDPLTRVTTTDWNLLKAINIDILGKSLYLRFWKNQNELIAQDLQRCNKSAWILPNYLAQEISRKLQREGKHSDIGDFVYLRPFLRIRLSGLIPLSLQNQFDKMQRSGIVDWWPNFINRTDLPRAKDIVPPTKPNMYGHTQVIFFIFCSGISLGFVSIIVELSGSLLKILKNFGKRLLCRNRDIRGVETRIIQVQTKFTP